MMNKKPSAGVEKSWLNRVAGYGCVITRNTQVQLHHCVGREGKQNKYYIGRLFVLPLEYNLHDIYGNSEFNVSNHKNAFTQKYGSQCDLFYTMCQELKQDGPLPFDDDVLAAIMETGA